ncbi:hybrid sensor histidine kinase/response regulator [Desulfamplus magnetovallimortis]|nr:PAS domain-containing protein [Desulfamplus magnetovallimortis]
MEEFRNSQSSVRLHFDYMDTRRNRTPEYKELLSQILEEKYKNKSFELIISTDNNALDYLLANRDIYYSTKHEKPIPIVFCGINNFSDKMIAGQSEITGIAEIPSIYETMQIARKLHPAMEQFVVVGSTRTLSSRLNLEMIKTTVSNFTDEIAFVYYIDEHVENLKNLLGQLHSHDVVLLSGILYDSIGNPLDFTERTRFIRKYSPSPIYSFWTHCMGNGIVGGKLVSDVMQGKMAAETAIKILNGETPETIPIIGKEANTWQFDYVELERFGIDQTLIPSGSKIINKPPSFYARYKNLLWGFLVILLEGIIIILLILNIIKRKETQKSLAANEKRFRRLVDHSSDSIYLSDGTGKIIDVNSVAIETTGFSREIMVKSYVWDIDPNYNEESFRQFWKNKPENSSVLIETTHRHKSGKEIPVEINALKFSEQGQIYYYSMARDISDRKKSELELERTLAATTEGIWWWNFAEDKMRFSERYYTMLGYEPDEFTASFENWKKLLHPDDYENALAVAEEYLKTKPDEYENEFRLKTKSGSYRWIHTKGRVVERDNFGNASLMIGNHEDVTEKKDAIEKLRLNEERLSLALQGANDGLWDWNMETNEVFYSPRWKEMLGYDDHEIVNHFSEWERLILPEGREMAWKSLNEYLEGKRENFTCEFRMRHKNGTFVDILSRAFAIRRDTDNQPVRVIGTHVDITERKMMEKRLQHSQKMEAIGNLAGGIAHDFNNLLFPIMGMSELLLEDLPPESQEYENAREILNAASRGKELVKQILAFSRQSDHQSMPVRIQDILKEVLKLMRSSIPSNIEIVENIDDQCGKVNADPTQIHQIIMNLITNACHSMETSTGKLSIELEESSSGHSLPDKNSSFISNKIGYLPSDKSSHVLSGHNNHFQSDQSSNKELTLLQPARYAILSVSDTGCGITTECMERIFDPYFTTKPQGKGTGLGLSMVYGIVKKYEGDVKVVSAPDKGTTVEVYLPLIKEQLEEPVSTVASDHPAGNENVLIVDDDESILNLETMMLKRLGYNVKGYLNCVDALELFRSTPHDFDLVISDMTMPCITGDMFAAEIRKIRSDIPIVICTGFSERMDEDKAKSMGINGFLMKPISVANLAKVVRSALS